MYETGKRIPSDDVKVRIAKYYDTTVQEIFFDDENEGAKIMNELQIFNNPEFGQVRTIIRDDGEIWLVGKDVCNVFGDTNHNRSLSRIDEEDKIEHSIIDSMGREQKAILINESGLYSLLFAMQPQKANKNGVADAYPIEVQERIDKLKKFKRWVTSEVLPTIRKTGSYGQTPLKDVVGLIRITRDNMQQQGATPNQIAETIDGICKQYGIELPNFIIRPEELTLQDAYDMIDFIYSQPRGKGHKKTTYDDYIAYKANMKMLGGE